MLRSSFRSRGLVLILVLVAGWTAHPHWALAQADESARFDRLERERIGAEGLTDRGDRDQLSLQRGQTKDNPLNRAVMGEPDRTTREISLSLGGGYDSNPDTAPDEESDSVFGDAAFSAAYKFQLGPADQLDRDVLTLGYDFQIRQYEGDADDNDEMANRWYAQYRRKFSPQWVGSVKLSDTLVHLSETPISNRVALEPSVVYRWAVDSPFATQLDYSYGSTEYINGPGGTFDLDANTHRVGGYQVVSLTKLLGVDAEAASVPGTLKVGFFHIINQADGSNAEFDANQLDVRLLETKLAGVEAALKYVRTWRRYDSQPTAAGAGSKRRDDIDAFAVELVRPLTDEDAKVKANLYLTYEYNHSSSNSATSGEYEQHLIYGGVIFSF